MGSAFISATVQPRHAASGFEVNGSSRTFSACQNRCACRLRFAQPRRCGVGRGSFFWPTPYVLVSDCVTQVMHYAMHHVMHYAMHHVMHYAMHYVMHYVMHLIANAFGLELPDRGLVLAAHWVG